MTRLQGLSGSRIRLVFGVAAMALAGFVFPPREAFGAPPKPKPDKSVTTVIEDADLNGDFTIASDDGGAYQNGVGGVSSILTANVCNGLTYGDWRFSTQSSSRSVMEGFFDPEDRAGAGPWTPPYVGYQPQKSWINVQCTCSQNQSIFAMTANQAPIVCPLINSWNDSNTGNLWRFSAFGGPNYPESTKVQIRCAADTTDSDGTHCVEWFIEPIGGLPNEAVGSSVETPSHGKPTEVKHGSYYMRFRIHVTLP